ncbi:uncharacterized protein LOC9653119 [Selaginella moellendorffii]|uniref:uncharacterized protein LOC9653119 n=1 Tax=Selaginella moellendorffii TaxID=88036 RepID=UPI000D1D080F|nr:uncharacterized protein LOC9653119 [Selaginella moellendorffii]|eukprot:XP_024539035.1 uncharacterized protein LOC9653119 [Selaginella moellendorffii]
MKGETPLDYCVFQLNEARCELWICAGDKNEKLASGSVKPFVAHLRAAKEQIAKGGSFIILQAPPFVGDGSPWFTKRTVERFVRFVSTPDVLESVSVLEAELAKLDDATSILVSDSSWSAPVTPRTGNLSLYKSDVEQHGSQTKVYPKRPSFDYAGIALLDGSKKDLLKAMEMRRMMLMHEQKKAFSHATAAGFNVSCISDLMVFANCFGAPRLWEACLKYMTLCKKRQDSGLNPEESLFDSISSGSSDASIQLMSNKSETSDSTEETSSGSGKSKARKTWDPQVLSTLQQLHARKVENGSLMSPDGKRVIRRQKTEDPSPLADEDLVVGARESVNNPYVLLQSSRSKVEHKTISVQDAISLFESKQQKVDDALKKKITKEDIEVTEPVKPAISEEQHVAESEPDKHTVIVEPTIADLEAVPEAGPEEVVPQQTLLLQHPSCKEDKQAIRKPSALAVVAEATELEELDNIEWRPLSKSSGFVFDDMFLDQRATVAQNNRRQSLCVWKTSDLESYNTQKAEKKESKGRFYDQYQEKREAKLKHEPVLKKAEKEAKLKAMQDVLETRRAELSTRSMRLTDKTATLTSRSKKDVESKSCELRIPSKRTGSVSSVHSAPLVLKADANNARTISVRKSSPSSQKSSTTVRASSSSGSKIQRRSAESLHLEHGKENADPLYTSDLEGPQKFKFLERKSKGPPFMTKKIVDNNQLKGEPGKASKSDGAVYQKKVPQTRQPSASSYVKGKPTEEDSKSQKTSADSCSASSEIFEMKLEGDDTESSCSCSVAGNATSLQKENLADDLEPEVTFLRVEVTDVEACPDVAQAEMQVKDEACIPTVEGASAEEVKQEVDNRELKGGETDEHRLESSMRVGSPDSDTVEVVLETAPDVSNAAAAREAHASIDMSVLIEELEREDELSEVKKVVDVEIPEKAPPFEKAKATPLFELAELDQKQFPAAYKVYPPLEDFSSTTGTQSEASGVSSAICGPGDPKVESFGSSKDEGEEATAIYNPDSPTLMVGSFLPRKVVVAGQTQPKCTIFPAVVETRKSSSDAAMARSSSEPGSPTRQPLFDLLANEHNTQSNATTSNSATAATSAATIGIKPLKSASHKLPHMCRLPSPDARGHATALLEKKNSAPSCAKLDSSSTSKPLRGIRKFLRFGRRSSSGSSAANAAADQTGRIMWQNGWFKGE